MKVKICSEGPDSSINSKIFCLFLGVWKTHQSDEEPVKCDIVFIAYGTILILESSVVHAGGIGYSDEMNLIMQFAFSNSALHVEHTQIKGSLDTEYCFNMSERVTLSEVCDEFSIYNQDTGTFNH